MEGQERVSHQLTVRRAGAAFAGSDGQAARDLVVFAMARTESIFKPRVDTTPCRSLPKPHPARPDGPGIRCFHRRPF